MDIIEVSLDRPLQGQAVTVTVQSEGTISRFNVQLWTLGAGRPEPRALTALQVTVQQNSDGGFEQLIQDQGGRGIDGLVIIITRLDADEAADPLGSHRVTLTSAAAAVDGDAVPDPVIVDGESVAQ